MLRYFLVVLVVGAASAALLPQYRVAKQAQPQQQYIQQARPQQQQFVQQTQQQQLYKQIPITSFVNTKDDAGQFSLQYQDGAGTVFTEQGVLKPTADGRDLVLVKSGSYSYLSPEGVPIQVSYEADENGFRPTGDAIPVAPVPAQA